MNSSTTFIMLVCAVVLGIAALFAVPSSVEPEAFDDQGALLFPGLDDPFQVKALEVYAVDEATAAVDVFNVVYEKGLWRIPSHSGYPADAKDRMATAAASLIGLKRDMICSDRPEDRALYGVEDPLDDAASSEGRGKRVVLKDGSGLALADVILGKSVEERRDWIYMREPEKKRIYAINLRPNPENYGAELIKDVSTTFSEWIDTDLLRLKEPELDSLVLLNYSVDETTGTLSDMDRLNLVRGEDDQWALEGIGAEEQLAESALSDLTKTLDELTIVGVRPTPEPLTERSLVSKGFFLNKEGNLFGNEGQMELTCKDGVIYHLFFGEAFFGAGETVTAGTEPNPDAQAEAETTTENRYFFVRVALDSKLEQAVAAANEALAAEKAEKEAQPVEETEAGEGDEAAPVAQEKSAAEKALEKAEKERTEATERMERLNLGFAKWYYVISGESYKKLRLSRENLVEEKLPDTSFIGEQPEEVTEPVTHTSGLATIEIRKGTGDLAVHGKTVRMRYTGWLKDGTVFDQNIDQDQPFSFTLGQGQVIQGWDEGVTGMRPGGKRKLIIPADLGYGAEGSGEKIPPHSTLIFDVELLSVESE